ncbi:hypothetical protein JXM83_07510 [Candidatus Woesearchaeota archaeon]|nr:hypothetical protein [Candidatus Woesearchaeota archaeon]
MTAMEDFIGTLVKFQVIEYVIPFLLVFSLVYAIMLKSKMFGDAAKEKTSKRFYIVISLAFGFASILPHYFNSIGKSTGVPDLVDITMKAFPQVSILLLVILSIFIVLGIFGARMNLMQTGMGAGILIFLVAIVVFIFLRAGNLIGPNTPFIGKLFSGQGEEVWSLIVALAVFGLVVFFIVRDEKPPGEEKLGDKMKKLFESV